MTNPVELLAVILNSIVVTAVISVGRKYPPALVIYKTVVPLYGCISKNSAVPQPVSDSLKDGPLSLRASAVKLAGIVPTVKLFTSSPSTSTKMLTPEQEDEAATTERVYMVGIIVTNPVEDLALTLNYNDLTAVISLG